MNNFGNLEWYVDSVISLWEYHEITYEALFLIEPGNLWELGIVGDQAIHHFLRIVNSLRELPSDRARFQVEIDRRLAMMSIRDRRLAGICEQSETEEIVTQLDMESRYMDVGLSYGSDEDNFYGNQFESLYEDGYYSDDDSHEYPEAPPLTNHSVSAA